MVLGIPPHSHSYIPLYRSLVLIPGTFTVHSINSYPIVLRTSTVFEHIIAAPDSLVYQRCNGYGGGRTRTEHHRGCREEVRCISILSTAPAVQYTIYTAHPTVTGVP